MPAVDFPNPRAAALSAYRNGTARGGVMAKPAMAAPGGPGAGLGGVQMTGGQGPGAVQTMPGGAGLDSAQANRGATVGDTATMGAPQTPRDALAGFRTNNPRSGATIGSMRATGAQKPRVPGIMRPNRMDYR